MKEKWDERFAVEEYIYGTEPNRFFSEVISGLAPGRLLLPAEGEGRNAVYAALAGWKVTALDFSTQGREKALKLAESKGVELEYLLGELASFDFGEEKYNAAALIYAHMPPEFRQEVHRRIVKKPEAGRNPDSGSL